MLYIGRQVSLPGSAQLVKKKMGTDTLFFSDCGQDLVNIGRRFAHVHFACLLALSFTLMF